MLFNGKANAAEHVTSVWMALKNKTELTIGICVGSSIVSRISRSPETAVMQFFYSKLRLLLYRYL